MPGYHTIQTYKTEACSQHSTSVLPVILKIFIYSCAFARRQLALFPELQLLCNKLKSATQLVYITGDNKWHQQAPSSSTMLTLIKSFGHEQQIFVLSANAAFIFKSPGKNK